MGGVEAGFERSSLRVLLDRLGEVDDPREPCQVRYPLDELLFLVTCATIAGCDDYDEIALWGRHHLRFLRGYGSCGVIASITSARRRRTGCGR